jgi:hypothetical protein
MTSVAAPKVPEHEAPKHKTVTPKAPTAVAPPSPWALELARVTYNSWQGPRELRDATINDLAVRLQALCDDDVAAHLDDPPEAEAKPIEDTDARANLERRPEDDDEDAKLKPKPTPQPAAKR